MACHRTLLYHHYRLAFVQIRHSPLKINLDETVVNLDKDLNIGVLSSDKTKFFFIDSRSMLPNLPFATNIVYLFFFFLKRTVSPVASANALGIIFDSNLSYNEPISKFQPSLDDHW